MGTFVIPKLPTDAAEARAIFEEVMVKENFAQLQNFKKKLKTSETFSMRLENPLGDVFLRFYQQDPELALRALRAAQKAQDKGLRKVALFKSEGLRFRESIVSELLEKINPGMDPPQQGRTATEFYFRVLADEKLGPHLIVNERLLTPKFSNAKTDSQRLESLKNALVWIAKIYPENLPKEYFFIAAIERWGWLSWRAQQDASEVGISSTGGGRAS